MPDHHRTYRGYLLILFAALSFGLYPAGAARAYADGANSTFLIIASTIARTIVLVLTALRKGTSLLQIFRGLRGSIGTGFFQALTIFAIIGSLRYIPGPVMITIVCTHTLMLLVILYLRKEAIPSPLAVGTCLIALVGIALVVDLFGNLERSNLIGVSLAGIAALGSATRLYVYGKQVEVEEPTVVGARAFFIATGCILLLLFFERPQAPHSLVGMTYTILVCLSLMLGTLLSFISLKTLGSFRTSLMLKCEPVFTCLFSWLLAGDALTATQYFGIGLVLTSLAWYQYREARTSASIQSR